MPIALLLPATTIDMRQYVWISRRSKYPLISPVRCPSPPPAQSQAHSGPFLQDSVPLSAFSFSLVLLMVKPPLYASEEPSDLGSGRVTMVLLTVSCDAVSR